MLRDNLTLYGCLVPRLVLLFGPESAWKIVSFDTVDPRWWIIHCTSICTPNVLCWVSSCMIAYYHIQMLVYLIGVWLSYYIRVHVGGLTIVSSTKTDYSISKTISFHWQSTIISLVYHCYQELMSHPKGGEGAFNYVVTALSKVLAALWPYMASTSMVWAALRMT